MDSRQLSPRSNTRPSPLFCRVFLFLLLFSVWMADARAQTRNHTFDPPDPAVRELMQELNRIKARHQEEIRALEERIQRLEETAPRKRLQTPENAEMSADPTERPAHPQEQDTEPAAPETGFVFSGYGRSGFTINSEGGGGTNNNDFASFRAPGAEADYRLGNENDTYVELGFENRWDLKGDAFFRVIFMPTFKNGNDDTFEDDTSIVIRQAFAEGGLFDFAPSLTFWAGERFYRRRDIHINDFYFSTQSSYGGGVEEIPVGDLKFAVAYLGIANDDILVEGQGQIAVQNLDLRLYEIPLPGGKLELQLSPSVVDGGDFWNEEDEVQRYNDAEGVQLGIYYDMESFFGVAEGEGYLTLQYGTGPGILFNPGQGVLSVEKDFHVNLEDQSKFRATAFGVMETSGNWKLMPALLFQRGDNGTDRDAEITWISAGIRPIYYFNEHLALQFEYGVDYVDNSQENYDGFLQKIAFAPTLSLGKNFWARPQLRIFGTYAFWSDEFKGRGVAGKAFEEDTEGFVFGMQMEAWWGGE